MNKPMIITAITLSEAQLLAEQGMKALYAVTPTGSPHTKVGMTTNLKSRLSTYSTGYHSHSLTTILVLPDSLPKAQLERLEMILAKRLDGEFLRDLHITGVKKEIFECYHTTAAAQLKRLLRDDPVLKSL